MKCPYCDYELKPGATSCDACGAPVEQPRAAVYDAAPEPITPTQPGSRLPEQDAFPQAQGGFALPEPPPTEAYPPPAFSAAPYPTPGATIFGLPSSSLGMISLILGIIGIALSCVGCGGILSLLGLAAGFYSLKTSSRQQGIIGMILSGIGMVIAAAVICLFLFTFPVMRNRGM